MEEAKPFVKPGPHIKFISWKKALAWAQHMGFPHTTTDGLQRSFARRGGKYGSKANAPHKQIPVPVEQFMQYLEGFVIRDSRR